MSTQIAQPLTKNIYWRILIPIARFLTRLVTTTKVEGAELLRQPGSLILAVNHISWADSFPLALTVIDANRLPRFLATEEIFRYPVFGYLARKLGLIPVRSHRIANGDTLNAAIASSNNGDTLIFYPEGKVTSDPNFNVITCRPGAIKVALATKNPLIPIAIWGPQQHAPKPKYFKPFPRSATKIKIGNPINLTRYYDRELTKLELEQLCVELQNELQTLLDQIRN